MMETVFMTVEELAGRYSVPVATVYAWIHKRTGPPSLKVGRYRRFRLSDVERWESERVDGAAGVR